MYIFWIIVGGIAILLFMIFHLVITIYMIKQYRDEEKRPLPGKRIHYVVISSTLMFIFLISLYSVVTVYVGAPNQIGMWLIITIPLSLSGGLYTYLNLRKARFR